jgi:adenine-specific DNA-methyltransferase
MSKDFTKATVTSYGSAESPTHELYCMDNMVMLNYTSERLLNSVDLAYIDPPYNTGNTLKTGFKYNDSFKDEDNDKHSTWITFISPRLEFIRSSLKDTGVIVCSIDDSEYAYLKVEMDKVFGESNFIANIIVDGGALKNNVRFVSTTHEYLLVYAKNLSKLKASNSSWRSRREGVDIMLDKVEEFKVEFKNDFTEVSKALQAWLKTSNLSKRLKVFKYVDSKGVYTHSDLSSPNSKNHYEFMHPTTGLPVKTPSRGWAYSEDALQALVDKGEVEFFANEKFQPLKKLYLKSGEDQVIKSVWPEFPARSSTHLLQHMLGVRNSFNNPKNLDFMKHIIKTMSPKDAVILDVFAGSGSTGHAVLELNTLENSKRKFILCTTNENNIYDEVTKPRLIAAASGFWADNEKHIALKCNIVEFKPIF